MKKFVIAILLMSFVLPACFLQSKPKSASGFRFFNYKDTIYLRVKEFYKNDGYCFNESGWPYAVIIGDVYHTAKLSGKITVLAVCDNRQYKVGQEIKLLQIPASKLGKPTRFTWSFKDTIINGLQRNYLIGSENPAIHARVIQSNR